jgi:hypothetical protein
MKSGTILQLFTTSRACLVVTRCGKLFFLCFLHLSFYLSNVFPTLFKILHLARAFKFSSPSCTAHAMRRAAGPACGFLAVLITVTLAYAATAPGDAAADGLLAGPASLRRASPPSRYPPSWATRCERERERERGKPRPLLSVFSPVAWYLRPRPRRLTEFQAQVSCCLAFPCVH